MLLLLLLLELAPVDTLDRDRKPPVLQPLSLLLYGRQQFFREGERVMQSYIREVQREEQQRDEERGEYRDYLRKGGWFLAGTIALDWIVCSL
jgi:hypothetical protein